MRTGKRCTTLVKLPLALSGRKTLNSEPVAGAISSIVPVSFSPWNASTAKLTCWPTLRRLACRGGRSVVLVAPPYVPYAPAWSQAGVDLDHLQVVHATSDADALWAAEQCLRSGACSAVLCWPLRADDRALRRLQVAAQTGQCLGFVFRDRREARNPSPAALRLELHAAETADAPTRVHVLKCRGGVPPNAHIPLLTVS